MFDESVSVGRGELYFSETQSPQFFWVQSWWSWIVKNMTLNF